MRARRDAGQLLPLYALVLFVACGSIVLLGHLGQLAHRRAEARTAADAAALAGAADGQAAAERAAEANGAVLEKYLAHGVVVDVTVRVGTTHANARAARDGECRPLVQFDPVHFAACQPTSRG
jgi:Flp pilus assembly protein TadG